MRISQADDCSLAAEANAVHEASHAVVLLAGGEPVEELTLWGDDGGICRPRRDPRAMPPLLAALASEAGAVGEVVFCNHPSAVPSAADLATLDAVGQASGVRGVFNRRDLRELATELLVSHADAVEFLAKLLLQQRTLSAADLAYYCRGVDVLSPFRDVYAQAAPEQAVPKPVRPPRRRVARRPRGSGVTSVRTSGAFLD